MAAADGSNVITILDVIGYDWWTGEGVTAKRVAAALRQIGANPVTVQINSPGGDFFEGETPNGGGGFHAQANAAVRIGSRTSPGSVTTSTVTITTNGATGSVSYAWSQLSGDDTWSITSAAGAATAFNTNVSTPGEQKRATFACLVTDAGSGRSFTIIVGAAALYNV